MRLVRATIWSTIGISSRQTIVFVVGIILARILEPSDFGLIGMVLVFATLGQVFTDFGFSKALIQSKENSNSDLSTVFYINLLSGILFATLFFLSSGLIARFYERMELVNLTRFISLIFIFNSLSIIQRTLLYKRIDLKSESAVLIIAALISGGVAIYLGYNGFGVWSLAIKLVLQSLLEAILFWIFNRWTPRLIFSMDSVRKYLKYALNMFGAGLLNIISQNIDKLIVGKLFSAAVLGYYDRAKTFNAFLQQNIGMIYIKVMFPALSEMQDDHETFLRTYRKSISLVSMLSIPFFFMLIVLAKPLIILLLTDKWLPAVKILQILAFSGFIFPISGILVNAIAAKGRADLFLKLDAIKTAMLLVGLVIGAIWDIMGVVIAITIVRYFSLFINFFVLSRLIDFSLIKQVRDIAHAFVFAGFMLMVMGLISFLTDMSFLSEVLILPIIGIAVYAVLYLVFYPAILLDLQKIIKALRQ